MLHKIQGKNTRQPVKHLKVNNSIITDTKEIGDTLGSTISYNSSSRHYSTNFLPHKTATEKQDIQFPPADEESYSLPISLSELKNSINAAHDSSPGPGFIHCQLLKHLPQSSFIILLNLLNKYWLKAARRHIAPACCCDCVHGMRHAGKKDNAENGETRSGGEDDRGAARA